MSEPVDVSKLKVPELRAELSKRGLNTFGTRQILVERLCEAMGTTSEAGKTTGERIRDHKHFLECDEPPTITSVAVKSNSQERPEEVSSRRSSFENGITDQAVESDAHPKSETDYKRKRSPSRSPRRRSRSRDRDSRRSPRRRSRSPASSTKMVEESVGWENSASVFLDSYNCDLSLILDAEGLNAKPLTEGGFSMMWSGVRANYGFMGGKAFYEVKNVRHIPVENLDSMSGGAAHVMRVGWSTENADFALGEEPQSFGYGGTAKKSTNNKFSNYGCTFDEGDVVGAFIEWTSNEAVMRFSVNGVDQGECFRVQKSTLGERFALFPHVYVKNVEFSVNFGQDGMPPWFPPNVPNSDPISWLQLNNVSISHRVHGRMPPASKAECEVIMMIGLPGAGKTYYAERLRADNREKQYTVLGTNLILDKMKVCGLSRQRNYHGRWDVLIDKATKCLNTLMGIASRRRRNYILDQTNVYPSAQRRKMRPFEGFKRKAIVIVPTDEEFRRRIAQREKEEGKEVPESAVLEMKANFEIPKPLSEDSSSVFSEVLFTELNSAEANELVQKYNQEGQANRPPPEKRQRWEGSRDRESSDSRFHGGHANRDRGRDYGRGRRDDFRRSPDRRDDRGRREYRGGYNAERDRSRDSDRYDRGRDRESYSRPNDRFGGGPPSRFGGPSSRGGYPPSMGPGGGYGGYGAPRGGGGMVMRGGRGAPYGNGMTRGYGNPYDAAPPMDFRGSDGRPPRGGRGGYRGGASEVGYGGPMDSMYGGPQGHYDSSTGKGGSVDTYGVTGSETTPAVVDGQPPPPDGVVGGGGYRGGYGPATRGSYGGAPDAGGYNARGPYGGAPDAGGYNSRGSYGGAPDASSYGTRGSYGGAADAGSYSTRGSYGAAADAGGYSARGSVGGAPPRGGRAGSHMDREGAPMGRGGAPVGRGTPFVRGGSGGRSGYPSSARGGYQGDQDSASGYSVGSSDRTQSYSSYPPGVPTDTYGAGGASAYPVTEDYSDRSRDRYSTSTTGSYGAPAQQPKSAGGYPGSGPGGYSSGYQRGGPPSYPGGGQTGYAGGYPPEGASGYSTANYPASDSLGSSDSSRGGRSGRGIGGPQATTARPYSSTESDKGAQDTQSADRQPSDPGSLYASGAARYGETRANATSQPSGPKQSRFDSKPAPTGQQSYSSYPPSSYPTGYGSSYGAGSVSANPPAPTNVPPGPGGARSARSRFDVGPGSNPSASTGGSQSSLPQQPSPAQPQMPSSQTGQASQQYGYAYASQGTKPDPNNAQSAASAQASYSYGYGYGGYGGGYGGQQTQPSQPTTAQSRPNTSATSVAPSLYASAVADKPQTSTAQAPVASAQSSSATDASAALAAAAYASYYGYGATTEPGAASASGTSQPSATGAMAAAQQFNAWQQQSAGGPTAAATTTPSVTTPQQGSAAAAYGSYYPGYSAYAAGYGTTNPSQTAPAAPSAQTMPQYYGGYR
ncbi:hypothetical protein P879_02611 [Paragonimus westermani]|uniref:Uncharacterized protein n=1 Tax=Paragonimus westermani TaxID=34504 RepID=A0A8T0DC66_9TREM|nr:hypothetical protein P879_02611 [Paragonimus westermani]